MSDHNQEPHGWFETYVQHRFDQLAEQVGALGLNLDGVRQAVPRIDQLAAQLKQLADQLDGIAAKLDDVRQTVPRIEERVRIQAVFFGVLGGVLPAVGALIYFAIRGTP